MYTFRNFNPTTKTNKNNITADNTIQYSSMVPSSTTSAIRIPHFKQSLRKQRIFFGLQSVGIKAKKAVLLVLHCYMIASCFFGFLGNNDIVDYCLII
uniref:Transmembrane protein n=1 Tax=Glossina palpalis gambiensis TaxID=67801 RepID=A0A1B0AMP2_9MUSC